MDRSSGIVVGVDQTRGSLAALDFALREGLARDCRVEVVTAWQWTSPYEGFAHDATTPESAKAVAAGVQDAVVQEALGRLDGQPEISKTVVHDSAAKVLVERAQTAAMLVVGSGRRNILSRALGSVSEYCIRHSPAPVVVVPDPERVSHTPPADVGQPTSSGVRF